MTGSTPTEQGDIDFDELFRAVWPRSVVAARRIVGPYGDPESLAAEALTRAYDRWPSVRRHPNPQAWVLRVTVNLALDRIRGQARRGDRGPIRGRSGAARPDQFVEAFDEASAVRLSLCAALSQLPDRQRHAVILRYICGCIEEEIAASMKISQGSVKTHLKRGLSRLRAHDRADPEVNLALAP